MKPITTTELHDILTELLRKEGEQPIWVSEVNRTGAELSTVGECVDHEGRHRGPCRIPICTIGWTTKETT